MIVLIGTLPEPANAFYFAFYRSFEICIGIVCALAVSSLVFPKHATTQLRDEALATLQLLGELGLDCLMEYENHRYDAERFYQNYHRLTGRLAKQKALAAPAAKEGLYSDQELERHQKLRLTAETVAHLWAGFHRQVSSMEELAFQKLVQRNLEQLRRAYDEWLSALLGFWSGKSPADAVTNGARAFAQAMTAAGEDFEALRQKGGHLPYPPQDTIHYHQLLHSLSAIQRALAGLEQAEASQTVKAPDQDKTAQPSGAPGRAKNQLSLVVWRQAVLASLGLTLVPLIWIWLDLPGYTQISVSVIVIMQPSTLETQRKILLRNLGCIAGGSFGLLVLGSGVAETFFPWLIIFFIGQYLFSYINFGKPASAYFGLQGGHSPGPRPGPRQRPQHDPGAAPHPPGRHPGGLIGGHPAFPSLGSAQHGEAIPEKDVRLPGGAHRPAAKPVQARLALRLPPIARPAGRPGRGPGRRGQ